MSYTYYPGCSAKGTGRSYEESLRAVFGALGTGLDELEDWNCCGASGYPAVDTAKAVALSARNLALAEGARPGPGPVDVIAPCAGCYRALLKTERAFADGEAVAARVGGALDAAGLRYEGRARVRHPLDVLVNDVGLDRIAEAAVRPLAGLRVACYYGCLLVRPYATFDDRRAPTSMERLLEAAGAEPIDLADADALLRRFLLLRRADHRRAPRGDTAAQPPAAGGREAPRRRRDRHGLPAVPVQPGGVPGPDGPQVR